MTQKKREKIIALLLLRRQEVGGGTMIETCMFERKDAEIECCGLVVVTFGV
jgi:hypothetical protein